MGSSSRKKSRRRNQSLLTTSPAILICTAIVKSKAGQKLLRLAVDTGSSFTVIPYEAAVKLNLDLTQAQEKETIVTANGLVYAPVIKVPLFGALGIELHDFKVLCHDLPVQSRVEGVLGLDFLSHFQPYRKFEEEIFKIAPQFWKP